ncbi:hypothetical protein D3C80_1681240 [compost metagenome]
MVHGRDYQVVGALWITLLEFGGGGLGANRQRRHQLQRAVAGGQGEHLGHLGAAEQAEGYQEVHQFGHAVLAHHGHQRLLAAEARLVGLDRFGILPEGEQGGQ